MRQCIAGKYLLFHYVDGDNFFFLSGRHQYESGNCLSKIIIRYKQRKLNACLYQNGNNYNNNETFSDKDNKNLSYYSLLPVISCQGRLFRISGMYVMADNRLRRQP